MIENVFDTQDVRRLERLLDRSTKIVLTCHVRPDGDAIGSTLGLYHILSAQGKSVKVVTPDQAPKSLSFLPGFNDVAPYTKYQDYVERTVAEADLIVCCDFNRLSRTDSLAPFLEKSLCEKVMIDHHRDPEPFCGLLFSRPDVSSTCELVFRLICAMGLYGEMNREAATCLCTGLITDTRNLSVNCDNPELYIIMYELIRKGVDKKRILREALDLRSLNSFRLNAFALNERMEILPQYRTAIITLSQTDLERFHYERGDTEGLVNEPLQIKGITASFFLREDPASIKISSRSVNDFPVNLICEELFDGGGHLQAAGGESKTLTLQECRDKLVKALPHYASYLRQNEQNATLTSPEDNK